MELQDFQAMWKGTMAAAAESRAARREDFNFVLGDQWDEADLKRLKDEKKPALVINKVWPLVRVVSGYQRTNRHRIKVMPASDEEDVQVADVLGRVTDHIAHGSRVEYALSRAFTDGVVGGEGWLYGTVDYSRNLDGEIRIRYQNPFQVLKDPFSTELDLSDCEFIIRWNWLSERQIFATYDIDEDVALDAFQFDKDADDPDEFRVEEGIKRYKVVEFWYRDNLDRHFVFAQGQFVEFRTQKEAKEYVHAQEGSYYYKHKYPIIRYAIFVGDAEPIEGISPYGNSYPLIPFTAFALSGESFGLVRPVKDPQREINKRRSQFIDIITREVHGGWIGDETALRPEDWKRLERNEPAPIIKLKGQGGRLERILPSGTVALAPRMAEQAFFDDLHQTSGINPEMLGITPTNETNSGRVVALRQQSGIVMLGELLDNFRLTHIKLGEFIIGAIQNLFTYERVFRIIGDAGNPEFVRINERAVDRILNDTTIGEYDVTVEQQAYQPTERWALLYALLDFANAGVPIPWRAILDASDLPNKEQLLAEMQQQAAMQAQGATPTPQAAGGARRSPQRRGRPGTPSPMLPALKGRA